MTEIAQAGSLITRQRQFDGTVLGRLFPHLAIPAHDRDPELELPLRTARKRRERSTYSHVNRSLVAASARAARRGRIGGPPSQRLTWLTIRQSNLYRSSDPSAPRHARYL